jgi:hypothetical protein
MWLHVSVFSRPSSGQYFPAEGTVGAHHTLWDPMPLLCFDGLKNHFILSILKHNGMSPTKVALYGSHVRPSVCILLSATRRLSDFHEIRRWDALQKKSPVSFSFIVNLFNSRSSYFVTTRWGHLYSRKLLMMGIVMPETCWAIRMVQ